MAEENERKVPQIACVVAGIDEEYQASVIEGIIACAKQKRADISCFAAFGGVLGDTRYDIGEYNIYNLVNYDKFDGVILLTNTIGAKQVRQKVITAVKASGKPAVVLDSDEEPSFYNVHIDNIQAMREIVEHILTVHNATTINFISGPLANPEAMARYHAFLTVMAEHKLMVDVNRVYFGEFRGVDGRRAIDALMQSGLALPDAVICANDAMALEAVSTLERYGVHVPQDVLVTGFDNTYYARHNSPSITTVGRPLFDAGKTACETLLRMIDGEELPDSDTELKAEPIYMESCGCHTTSAEDMENFRKSAFDMINNCRKGISLLNRVTSSLAETETTDESLNVMAEYLHEMDCDQYCICLCDDWQNAFHDPDAEAMGTEEEEKYRVQGYTKTMSAPLIWRKNAKTRNIPCFAVEDMYPEPLTGKGGNVSYFLPLHFVDRCLGYYIVTNSDFPLKSQLCHSLMMNISHSLENIRKLLHLNNAIKELDRLYVIDPLCNIYNRNGFIRLADKMFHKAMSQGTDFLISFIDMDGLKMVNDNYGHEEGDFALQRLASVIAACCEVRGRVCARFGGDEFIIVATDVTAGEAERLELEFNKRLQDMNRIIHKPYQLSASIGTLITKVGEEETLFSLITKADKMMYEQKKKKKTSRYLRRE